MLRVEAGRAPLGDLERANRERDSGRRDGKGDRSDEHAARSAGLLGRAVGLPASDVRPKVRFSELVEDSKTVGLVSHRDPPADGGGGVEPG